ncbi:MAG: hypothetical protein IPK83_22005 [Planctomycetes bacterium]|nr:hypothetical protein [Planctomycetota bacterium]
MKLSIICISCLFFAVIVTAAVGYAPTQSRWGAEGVNSMLVIAAICLASAVIAFLPIMIVAPRWPDQIGSAALAGHGAPAFPDDGKHGRLSGSIATAI